MNYRISITTPLGEMIALAEENSLCGLRFAGQRHEPEITDEWRLAPDLLLFTLLREQLDAYFSGTLQQFDLPLLLRGTPFRLSVWNLLRDIPSGTTTTYGALAKQLTVRFNGHPCPQAVGGAVGHNPLALIIPCHRVVGANGTLTGYAGGIHRKAALLEREKR
jgi:methylated-DNA-[protein]-cysteine S-methyltransferase